MGEKHSASLVILDICVHSPLNAKSKQKNRMTYLTLANIYNHIDMGGHTTIVQTPTFSDLSVCICMATCKSKQALVIMCPTRDLYGRNQ